MSSQDLAITEKTYEEAGPSASTGSSVPVSQSSSGSLQREGFLVLSAMLDSPEFRSQLQWGSGRAVQGMAKRGGPDAEHPLDANLALDTMKAFLLSLDLFSGRTSAPSRRDALYRTRIAYTKYLGGEYPNMRESAKNERLNLKLRAAWSIRLESGRKGLVDLWPTLGTNGIINDDIFYLPSASKEEILDENALKILEACGRVKSVAKLLPSVTKVNLILATASSLWDLTDYELVAAANQAASNCLRRDAPAATQGSASLRAQTALNTASTGIAEEPKASFKATSTDASDQKVHRKGQTCRSLVARNLKSKHKHGDSVTKVEPFMFSSILAKLAKQLSARMSELRHTPCTIQYTSQQGAVSHINETATVGYPYEHSAPDPFLSPQQSFPPTAIPCYWPLTPQVPADLVSAVDWVVASYNQPDQEHGEGSTVVATHSQADWANSYPWGPLHGLQ